MKELSSVATIVEDLIKLKTKQIKLNDSIRNLSLKLREMCPFHYRKWTCFGYPEDLDHCNTFHLCHNKGKYDYLHHSNEGDKVKFCRFEGLDSCPLLKSWKVDGTKQFLKIARKIEKEELK